ncbi:MAG: Unknown protein [uncultured Sulfurovum sp.]|uniref:Calx-beta domain-containing protein n=1 Tax=uncultured Sulfurovum sp. TaxID=269237 RepID=A0A6S6TQJ2_9BACT|nr:MAG: Unknown protein [uncultured Sulfurovum sp.]
MHLIFRYFLFLSLFFFSTCLYADGSNIQISIANAQTVQEDAGTALFTIHISEEAEWCDEVIVNYSTADGSAHVGSDYSNKSSSLTFYGECDAPSRTASAMSQTLSIPIVDDANFETSEYFFVNISNTKVGYEVSDGSAYVYISDDDGIKIDITGSNVQEGDIGDNNNMEFKIFLSEDYLSTIPLSINYTTQDGSNPSATAGLDYVSTMGSVTFNQGDREKIISVPIIADDVLEPDEKIKMVISGSPYIIDFDSEAKIINDDGSYPQLSFDLTSYSIVEGDAGQKDLNFSLQLDQAAIAGASFKYKTQDDSALSSDNDYTTINTKTHTFTGGERTLTLAVGIEGDTKVEADEAFKLVIFNPSSNLKLSASSISSKGIILNDDTNPSSIKNVGEFRFDDCGNDEWKIDHSQLKNHALSASPTVIQNDGKSYMCSSLNGYTGTVTIPHNTAYELNNGTISMLLYDHHNIWSSNSWMFQKGAFKVEVIRVGGDAHQGSLKVYLDGNVIDTQEVFFTNSDGGDLDTQWVHVALTFGTQGMKLYINGIEKGSHAYTGGIKAIHNDFSMTTLSGYYDEFYIFEGQMSAIQVANLYQNTSNDKNIDGTSRDCGCYVDSDPFTCDNSMYISSSTNRNTGANGKMWLHKIDTTQNPFNFEVVETLGATELYNATAYNPDDNYIYGLYHKELVQLSRGAEVTHLGTIHGLPSRFNSKQLYAGAIGGGYYYVTGRKSKQKELYKIKLSDKSVSEITLSQKVSIQDFSFYKNVNDAIADNTFLYGVDSNGKLTKIDVRDGTVTQIGSDHNGYQFDSSFSDKNGRFFANDSKGNGFFEFNVATGDKNLVSNSQSATFNDGANCVNAALVFNDYGDAPATYGTAKHNIANDIFMGDNIDHDVYTFNTTNADGDDLDGVDDEDGVTLADGSDLNGTYLALNSIHNLNVKVSKTGYLNVWIDYNIDGDFEDVGEKIVTAMALTAGIHTISINVPNGLTSNTDTYLRFRYSSTANLTATQDANDGEVEDYMVQFGSDALRGKFNIERTNSGGFAIMSDERNAWYTQVVGRDFNYSLVFYQEDFSAEQNVSNVTVKIDLMDMENNSSIYNYSFHILDTVSTSRIDITQPINDLATLPATKDARFRVSYGVDVAGNIIQADCLNLPSACSHSRLDDAHDNFAIRPKSFYVSIADGNAIRKENTNALPNPLRLAAGYDYNLSVIATQYPNHNQTASKGYNANFTGALTFASSMACADDANVSINTNFVEGTFNNLNFHHDNVGKYRLHFKDSTWTSVDRNKQQCDMNSSDISTHPNSSSGCNIESISDINLSFYPYAFELDFSMNNLPNSGHNDFIYMSDVTKNEHNVSLQFMGSITAKNENNGTTNNFTKSCMAEDLVFIPNASMLTDDGLIPIKTAQHPTRNRVDVPIIRMANFNHEELNSSLFDTIEDIASPLNITASRFLNENNGTSFLELRYNIQKHLSLAINPVQINFDSLEVNSIASNSTAEGKIAPNFFPVGSQDLDNTLRNFYFTRVSPDKLNYPKVYFNSNPIISTPLNIDIFCNAKIAYCEESNLTKHTDTTGISRVTDGWYISTSHNTNTDGMVQTLTSSNPTILSVSPDNNISFVSGRNQSVQGTFNSCASVNQKVSVLISPDTSLLYDDNPANMGYPKYTVSCSNQDASQLSGIGKTGNIIDNQANGEKNSKIDW